MKKIKRFAFCTKIVSLLYGLWTAEQTMERLILKEDPSDICPGNINRDQISPDNIKHMILIYSWPVVVYLFNNKEKMMFSWTCSID